MEPGTSPLNRSLIMEFVLFAMNQFTELYNLAVAFTYKLDIF